MLKVIFKCTTVAELSVPATRAVCLKCVHMQKFLIALENSFMILHLARFIPASDSNFLIFLFCCSRETVFGLLVGFIKNKFNALENNKLSRPNNHNLHHLLIKSWYRSSLSTWRPIQTISSFSLGFRSQEEEKRKIFLCFIFSYDPIRCSTIKIWTADLRLPLFTQLSSLLSSISNEMIETRTSVVDCSI